MRRIRLRGRAEEKGIQRDFLKGLAGYYSTFPQVMKQKYDIDVLTIDVSRIDIREKEQADSFIETVRAYLDE